MNRNKVEIRIAGKDYKLVGVDSDEYMQRIGLYVDKKMNEILKRSNNLSTSMAAVLTSLNIAEEYMRTRDSEEVLRKEYEEAKKRERELRDSIDNLESEKEKLTKQKTDLQLELAKREAELAEVRSTLEKTARTKGIY
ncbi:MAG: cell division protein ZapA [Eubacteriales bacterium]|nr:cell division protein ZapA [Eubacteriales bacterium]